jgi:hypothetical protein
VQLLLLARHHFPLGRCRRSDGGGALRHPWAKGEEGQGQGLQMVAMAKEKKARKASMVSWR